MVKVGLTVLSVGMLLLVCDGCANSNGIRYGSTIEIDAGSDRANERRAGAGLFFGATSAGSNLAARTARRADGGDGGTHPR
jgi:hypothetical protein